MAEGEKIPLSEQIKEVGREIGLRRSVYPGFVQRMKMSQQEADMRIATMEAVLATLKWVERHQDELRQIGKGER